MGCFKETLGYTIVVVLVLLGCSTLVSSTLPAFQTWHVNIVNGLNSGQTLFVHCKSRNDDLGEHNLNVGTQFSFSFKDNFLGTTLFWCYLRKPNNAHAAFDAYWIDNKDSSWLFKRCDTNTCIWIAKDDGIYIRNIPANQDELAHPWE